jgi:hypothetical protein
MKTVLLAYVLLTLSAFGLGQVACPSGVNHCSQLTWSASTTGSPTSYNVHRSLVTGGCSNVSATTCSKVGTVTAPTLQFVDSPLAATTTYFYVVTAVNAVGESGPSNQASVTTGQDPLPAAPTNVSVIGK